ncbi:cystathionine beta-lyase [Evansella caseinilytica]|uniref:cysteine-S-conjugate beta-lyase n=1 Tax=Evansella caseinilytica TaxID=1503961 RepID=A0A1H3RXT9_9BACI|nr:cystathionine beta-lyase [Evansella caseinilytica]SDZ30536.1 cystathionine beta-lyase [Evansella caseinilytica]
MANCKLQLETRLIHNNHSVDPGTGAVSVPIHHASTFHQADVDAFGKYDYARSGNPTREALEDTIAQLEGGTRGFAFSSGMAAISTVFLLLSKGDHVIVSEDVYGGTFRVLTEVLSRFGIEHSFVDTSDLKQIEGSLQPNTKVIYVETPSNPLLKVSNLRAICELAKKNNCLTFVDNTFLTPILQRPLELGADIVIHSATKFIAGHSDVVAGLAVVRDEQLAEKLAFLQNTFGAVLGVQDSWLVLRGLKTLHVRLKQSQQSAGVLAYFFDRHPAVKQVYYPGLENHQGHAAHFQQASGAGAVLSFRLAGEAQVKQLVERLTIPVFAVSLGAVESILSYPAKMSHAAMPEAEREKRGIHGGLLRLSVGLENIDDLLADFTTALDAIAEGRTSAENTDYRWNRGAV